MATVHIHLPKGIFRQASLWFGLVARSFAWVGWSVNLEHTMVSCPFFSGFTAVMILLLATVQKMTYYYDEILDHSQTRYTTRKTIDFGKTQKSASVCGATVKCFNTSNLWLLHFTIWWQLTFLWVIKFTIPKLFTYSIVIHFMGILHTSNQVLVKFEKSNTSRNKGTNNGWFPWDSIHGGGDLRPLAHQPCDLVPWQAAFSH